MSDLRTNYRADEQVEPGDLVELFDGAFGVAIVTHVLLEGRDATPTAHLERPMANVYGCCPNGASVSVERLSVSVERLKREYKVFRRNESTKDNRHYGVSAPC
jgi:hypothetical protein